MNALRCGRIDDHKAHDWTAAAYIVSGSRWPEMTYRCVGEVVITLAEREWEDRADFDELREWLRAGWAS